MAPKARRLGPCSGSWASGAVCLPTTGSLCFCRWTCSKDTGQSLTAHRPQATVHQAKAREKASSRDPDRANDHIAPNTPRFRRSAHLSKTASTSTAQDTTPQRDGTRVGISLLRAPNNCSPLPPSAINESVSTSKKRLRISSPSRRHKIDASRDPAVGKKASRNPTSVGSAR